MTRIGDVFTGGHKALAAYITAGYPAIKATPEIARALAESGADIIELGIPFSDPLADGATIQKASYRALQNGTTMAFRVRRRWLINFRRPSLHHLFLSRIIAAIAGMWA